MKIYIKIIKSTLLKVVCDLFDPESVQSLGLLSPFTCVSVFSYEFIGTRLTLSPPEVT